MHFTPPLLSGTLIRRYKRFFADVALDSGEHIQAHCPNTGAMKGVCSPGMRVLVQYAPSPGRSLSYTWQATQQDGEWVGVNTYLPNRLVREAFSEAQLDLFSGYERLEAERPWEESRIDFLLHHADGSMWYIEVKNVHYRHGDTAFFPDCPTTRGVKHLHTLARIAEKGIRASVLYVVQRSDCSHFQVAGFFDADYGHAAEKAWAAGVTCYAWGCSISPQRIAFARPLTMRTTSAWKQEEE